LSEINDWIGLDSDFMQMQSVPITQKCLIVKRKIFWNLYPLSTHWPTTATVPIQLAVWRRIGKVRRPRPAF